MRDQDFKTDEGEFIRLNGVRQNNIKNIDVQFPLGKMTVVTGLSGSGKSSLVFETLHAEGQRRYVETFSAYTRQFLDLLDKPEVDVVVNIRPSIAIQQSNTVKTSRSTVGTMTELCDYFKVWFNHQCECFDPETGELVVDEHPEWIFDQLPEIGSEAYLVVAFRIQKPEKLKWNELISPIVSQGYQRTLLEGRFQKLGDVDWGKYEGNEIIVIQDRIKGPHENASRCIDALTTAQHFGSGEVDLYDVEGSLLRRYSRGLHSTKSGKTFRDKSSALFSFNSPLGACPKCRGFGRVIEIDYNLVIPDRSISIKDGAIRAFSGEVYQESLNDLLRACRKKKIKTSVPWQDMSESDLEFVMNGEPGYQPGDFDKNGSWYGVKRFFQFLESTTYKMHVRVFLSKYRSYVTCPDCGGTRLQPESLNWKWEGYRLPDLYRMPIRDLYQLVSEKSEHVGNTQVDIARESILNRLKYLNDVGLGYLNLDRSSRTLSGGEVERVNLTACLGTQLTDTLFVLDEPSVGLHSRDIDRLIRILRLLTSLGNTVVLVEHDERVIQAADHLIEMGPRAGSGGGELVFEGTLHEMKQSRPSLTGAYLSGRKAINIPQKRRVVDLESFPLGDENLGTAEKKQGFLTIRGASKHNIKNLNLTLPLNRFVCLTGVSGSGKSTLLNNVIYQGLMQTAGRSVENPARIEELLCDFDQPPILVDQSAVSRTPRSNPALFADAWELIRKLYASTEGAKSLGFTHSEFSFNGGNGRCEHCQGLGYEKVEMQFLSDVYVKCPVCEDRRFKKSVLGIEWNEKSIADVLEMDIWTAVEFFSEKPKIKERLNPLVEVGLGYLKMGQPLNTLSGGESQRLKLVKYLSQLNAKEGSSMLLLDEPTTGLHKEDVNVLIDVLQKIVDHGHSLFVIEHHIDVIQAADWVVEMGPDSGNAGGELVAAGKPEWIAQTSSETAKYLFEDSKAEKTLALVAEEKAAYRSGNGSSESERFQGISLRGAREHNLKNLDVQIPNQTITVVTGVSGSGKSSLAFDIIFAEGQRRFMESMSAYARQFVEQLPRPDIDELKGISPTVAIEQRVTRGSRKSTVATITEVAQYLRLLYARMGVQHSPVTGDPVIALPFSEVESRATRDLEEWISNAPVSGKLYLCASVIRGRKGHHQPIANWAIGQGFEWLRCDGKLVKLSEFEKLNRYEEHDIDVVLDVLKKKSTNDELNEFAGRFLRANQIGKGSFFYLDHLGKVVGRYSTSRVDPVSGVVYPELDPKHFS
ncbi:MAG: excinuclease ABC subunit UvrA, partial [Opitutales bacterium]|nr:excinuclease ABC subunit UvrA [Opitutales bacterium]